MRERFRIVEAERAAQVHHPQARVQKLRHDFQRSFVRRREKHRARSARGHGIDRKRLARRFAPAAQVRKNLGEALHVRRALAQVKGWLLNFRVPEEKLGQLETCIARRSDYGDPLRVVHRSRSSMRFWTAARAWRDGVITTTVSSPAMVPATSLNFSASSAAASGCAPEGGVFSTSKLKRGAHVHKKFPQGPGERRHRRRGFVAVGERLVARGGLDQLQLGHVPGKRPLRHAHLHVRQPAPQFVLARNGFARHQFQDLSLPEPLVYVQCHGRLNFMHPLA